MTFDEYQRKAMETAVYPAKYDILYPALALAEEAGEVAGKVAKVLRDNHGVFSVQKKMDIMKELGDVLWQVSALASGIGASLEDIASDNINKTSDRAARGKLQGSGDNR